MENLDHQVHEQEKLRQNARTMLAILQRTKAQLIELRPTISSEGEQKLKVHSNVSLSFSMKSLFSRVENR